MLLFAVPAVAIVLCIVMIDFELSFPSMGTSSPFSSVRLYAIFPLACGIAVSYSLEAGERPGYVTAARRISNLDYILIITPIIVTVVVAILSSLLGSVIGSELVRNAIGFIGIQMIAAPILGYRLQSLVPVVYVFLSALFGRTYSTTVSFWAWPLGDGDLQYWYLPIFIFILGTLAHFSTAPHRVRTEE